MKNIILTSICLFIGAFVFTQTSINTSVGGASNPSGSIIYSIGQVTYQSTSNTSGSVSQGVQYAFEISTLSLEENTLYLSLIAYPKPKQELLNLSVGNYSQEKLVYKLVDL
jgi:hypothetical protein